MSIEEDYSFEKISQIRQKERRKPLSRLPPDFYERFSHRLDTLKRLYQDENAKDPTSLKSMMYADEVRKTKLILDEIHRRRIRKIILAALGSASENFEPPGELLPTERQLFDDLVAVLKSNKRALDGILGIEGDEEPGAYEKPELRTEDLIVMEPQAETEAEEREETAAPAAAAPQGKEELALVRVLGDTGSFMSPDQRSYNLRKEDILELPSSIARILIEAKKAELYSA